MAQIIYGLDGDQSQTPTPEDPMADMSLIKQAGRETTKEYEKSAGFAGIGLMVQESLAEPAKCKSGMPESDKIEGDAFASCNFADAARTLSIQSTDLRILCYFLDATSPNDVKKATKMEVLMISNILMEVVPKYMHSIGYAKVGELNFDCQGNITPCGRKSWTIKGAEVSFICSGFLYFENKSEERIVIQVYSDDERGMGLISAYHRDDNISKQIIKDINTYAKKTNCISGAKIRDVNMTDGSFTEIAVSPNYTWDNYYYEDSVKELFDLEVFGFLSDLEHYRSVGINKRGLMLYGRPGTGKTTIGYLVCQNAVDNTVIWITPEILRGNAGSVNLLYKLADYVTPAVVILEDLDLFAEDREGVTDSLRLGALMNILDGVNSIKDTITIATTNRIGLIEQALSNRPGRFDRKIEIDSLNDSLRKRMLNKRLEGFDTTTNLVDYIVTRTSGWSGAEVQEFVNTINLYFIKHKITHRTLDSTIADAVFTIMNDFGAAPSIKAKGTI